MPASISASPNAAPGESFGALPDGRTARLFTLENDHMRVRFTDYGGRIVSLETAGRDGKRDDVVLGFDTAGDYAAAGGAFGALLGRTANRIGGGAFTLDRQVYRLSQNEGDSTLHGGAVGFDKVVWIAAGIEPAQLVFTHTSPDGDQGFPGEVSVTATYRLDGDVLWLDFAAQTTKPTPLSLSAHPYFNLAGRTARDMLDHRIEIMADRFLPTDRKQVATGEIRGVAGTVFDFRTPQTAAARIRKPDPQLLLAWGYDHYYILAETADGAPRLAARVSDPHFGRTLEILTTQPGTQFYTGNHLNGSVAGRDGVYRQSAGFAFEPQGYPDAPNRPEFPTTILRPGTPYRQTIGYRLSAA